MWLCVMFFSLGGTTLTLEQALHIAHENQPKIQQALAAKEIAEARKDQALSSFFPQITASGTYQRTTTNFVPRPGAVPSNFQAAAPNFSTSNFFNFGVTLNQLIYDFEQTRNKWQAEKANVKAQVHNQKLTWQQLMFDVRSAYFQAYAMQVLVNVADDTLKNQHKHLTQIQGFVDAGTRAPIDLAQAKTDYANASVQLVNAQNNAELAKAKLNQVMGVELSENYRVEEQNFAAVDVEENTPEILATEALQARPDFLVIQQQIKAQELTINAELGGYAPTLNLTSNFSDAGPAMDNLGWNWNAGVTLNWAFLQGGLTVARVNEARATLFNLNAQTKLLKQQVQFELEQARLAIKAAKASLEYTHEALINANERLKLAEGRYEAGVGNALELGDAQIAKTNAAAQEVQANYQLALARAQLLKALGRE